MIGGRECTDRLDADAATRAESAEGVELGLLARALQLHLAQVALQVPDLRLLLLQLGLRWRCCVASGAGVLLWGVCLQGGDEGVGVGGERERTHMQVWKAAVLAFWRSRKDCWTWALVSGFFGPLPLLVVVMSAYVMRAGWSSKGHFCACRSYNATIERNDR